ncbi:MAG TPA: TPM domain-containing protein [Candidatus Limnocylindrales bacterium]|nr:TPM domain-containing protein [Candidatus Limnocylindrales bacterium]
MERPVGHRSSPALLRLLSGVALALGLVLPSAAAAAGPPFPDPVDGQAVYDTAELFSADARNQAELIIDAIESQSKAEVVVYTQALGRDDITTEEAELHARALMDQWGVGRQGVDDGLVILFDLDTTEIHGQVQLFAGPGFSSSYLSDDERQAIYEDTMVPLLARQQFDDALIAALAQVVQATVPGGGDPPAEKPGLPDGFIAPGPPFPDPEIDRAVYDFAGIFSADAIVRAESTIDKIEARTGAEIVVYSESVDYGVSTEETESRAQALIDQWGIGRRGFDDGMVVFFDIDPSGEHGQVQLFAAQGFRATYLTNEDRQKIYENDMVPFLQNADFDGALDVAMRALDAAVTPENAQRLQLARQANAAIGLIGAPIVFLGLVGWVFFSWRRYGRDPVYLDDPSILMPAPPPDLTAASGAFVMDGHSSRRALTTAMLDLASRGLLTFREDKGLLGLSHKVGIDTTPAAGDPVEEAHRARNARRPIGPAEDFALRRLRVLAGDGSESGFIEPDKLPEFGTNVSEFDSKLEDHVVKGGWVVEKPSRVVARWIGKGILAVVAGVVAIFIGVNVPISGLVIIGGAAIAGGIVVMLFARSMPKVTMPGAMVRAMLAAYRRTLQKTMEQSRSMQQVVDQAGLPWLETPDQAVVWGTALGLQADIEGVLKRSLDDVRDQPQLASSTYFPGWYQTSNGSSFASGLASGGGSIFSGSAVPDVGGMMSALGTIGNSPSSSGSGGGGGGFGGGSSGGGGGGAGGGF